MNLEELTTFIILPMMSLAALMVFIRLVRGPDLPDRVVALDLLTNIGIGIIAAYAIATDTGALIDVAIILALIAFLGTIAFAYFIEQRVEESKESFKSGEPAEEYSFINSPSDA
jgi:multicomponent Na+:H+ antiporter subunit F